MLSKFCTKLYGVVENPLLDPVISWSKNNNSFIVWNMEAFSRVVLRKCAYIMGQNLSKFMSLLMVYGFSRIKGFGHQWEFGHDLFIKGQPELLNKMMLPASIKRFEEITSERKKSKRAKQWARKNAPLANVDYGLQHNCLQDNAAKAAIASVEYGLQHICLQDNDNEDKAIASVEYGLQHNATTALAGGLQNICLQDNSAKAIASVECGLQDMRI